MINADLHGIGNRNIMMLCYVYYIRHFRDISRIQSPLRPASPFADGPRATLVSSEEILPQPEYRFRSVVGSGRIPQMPV